MSNSSRSIVQNELTKNGEYTLFLEDFLTTPVYKSIKRKSLISALLVISIGLCLPMIISFFLTLPYIGKDYFYINFISNSIITSVFCLPLSVGIIWFSLPIYKHSFEKLMWQNGFIPVK